MAESCMLCITNGAEAVFIQPRRLLGSQPWHESAHLQYVKLVLKNFKIFTVAISAPQTIVQVLQNDQRTGISWWVIQGPYQEDVVELSCAVEGEIIGFTLPNALHHGHCLQGGAQAANAFYRADQPGIAKACLISHFCQALQMLSQVLDVFCNSHSFCLLQECV